MSDSTGNKVEDGKVVIYNKNSGCGGCLCGCVVAVALAILGIALIGACISDEESGDEVSTATNVVVRTSADLVAEIQNGRELVTLFKRKNEMNSLQYDDAFKSLKGRYVVFSGVVRDIGKTMFGGQVYVSLTVDEINAFERCNIQFNVSGRTADVVKSWSKGESHVMRGLLKGSGDLEDDAECAKGEIIPVDRYRAAVR